MREPKPFFKKSHQRWYVQLDKVQYPLGADEAEAREEYYRLMAGRRSLGSNPLVLDVVQEFLIMSKRTHATHTYTFYSNYCDWFVASLPKGLRMSGLKPHHLLDWVDKRWQLQQVRDKSGKVITRAASVNTRQCAMRAVKRPFNWAAELEKTTTNPFKRVKLPRSTRREAYLTPADYAALLPCVTGQYARDVVETLRHTGCRPQELRTMEARWYNRCGPYWEFPAEGVPKKCQNRVIHLDDTALAITERLVMKNPEGPIFLNSRGEPWTRTALVRLCERLGCAANVKVTPYSFRHTFVTDGLLRGTDVVTLAKIVGHTDLRMINSVYTHIDKRSDHVREQMLRAVGHL